MTLVLRIALIALAELAVVTTVWGDERTACREAWASHLCTLYPNAYPKGESDCRKSILSECIAHCDTGCWVGYAWNKHSKNFEWFWSAYDSYSECTGAAKSEVEISDSYREPFGCAYTSTSLWRTFLWNKWWGPRELVCIAKIPNKLEYSPTFRLPTVKEEKEGSHCVVDLPYSATIRAQRAEALAKENTEDAVLGCHEPKEDKEWRREHGGPAPGDPDYGRHIFPLCLDAEEGKWPYQYPPCIGTDTACYTDVPQVVVPRERP